jgi:hypothetical protein
MAPTGEDLMKEFRGCNAHNFKLLDHESATGGYDLNYFDHSLKGCTGQRWQPTTGALIEINRENRSIEAIRIIAPNEEGQRAVEAVLAALALHGLLLEQGENPYFMQSKKAINP